MSAGDLQPLFTPSLSPLATRQHQVVSGGTPPAINAGEPVGKTLGNEYVVTMATNKPVSGTDYLAGISVTASTETATANGTVDVTPISSYDVWLISPKVAATWNTQALYNALVGTRVLLDKTSGAYTILASDSANNGCVIENLNIATYPGKVAFSFRGGVSYLA